VLAPIQAGGGKLFIHHGSLNLLVSYVSEAATMAGGQAPVMTKLTEDVKPISAELPRLRKRRIESDAGRNEGRCRTQFQNPQ
jgi:hypothetical protein